MKDILEAQKDILEDILAEWNDQEGDYADLESLIQNKISGLEGILKQL